MSQRQHRHRMSKTSAPVDHSGIEEINCSGGDGHFDDSEEIFYSDEEEEEKSLEKDDEIFNSDDDDDNLNGQQIVDYIDTNANDIIVATRQCKIYPKSRTYAIIRFGDDFKNKAIALMKLIFNEEDGHHYYGEGEICKQEIAWGQIGWLNAKRDLSNVCGLQWKATLVWIGQRKPSSLCEYTNAHHNDEVWNRLLIEYADLGEVDTSMRPAAKLTLKSLANELCSMKVNVKQKNDLDNDFDEKILYEAEQQLLKDEFSQSTPKNKKAKDLNNETHYLNNKESNSSTITLTKLQLCGYVDKVENNLIKLASMNITRSDIDKQYHGQYNFEVNRKNIYINGINAANMALKENISPGESLTFHCSLMFDTITKDRFGDVKIAWIGKYPEEKCTKAIEQLSSEDKDRIALNSTRSLEPIHVPKSIEWFKINAQRLTLNLTEDDKQDLLMYRNIPGYVQKITKSLLSLKLNKVELIEKYGDNTYSVMSQNVYLINGIKGSNHSHLEKSGIKENDYMKMNLADINGKLIILSAWQPGTPNYPRDDEGKAIKYAQRIRKHTRNLIQTHSSISSSSSSPSIIEENISLPMPSVSITTSRRARFDDRTPPSQMSAMPHSPSYFYQNF